MLAGILLAVSIAESSGLKTPRPIVTPTLHYPEMARMARIQGIVTLKVRLADDGRVTGAEVAGTTSNTTKGGDKFLSNAAIDNVTKWEFEPTDANAPTIREFEMQYVFRLRGKPSPNASTRMKVKSPPLAVEITGRPPQVMY